MRRQPRGRSLLKTWSEHPGASVCPGCDLDVQTVGLSALAYVFDVCACELFGYEHLVEQLWHRSCLVDS